MRRLAAASLVLSVWVPVAWAGGEGDGGRVVDFDRDVRPILSGSCYRCHGPDDAARKAGLRLDTKAGAFDAREGAPVIVAGDPGASELIRRVASDDPEERMPPPDSGYHGDNHREVSLYRDYVIAAFNANLPFDRFTTEQLAGDLLPGPTDSQRVASGYNALLMTTREGGAQAGEYRAKYAADRVRNASTVWAGSTLGCAECHDHKFDPFTATDFYRFAAFFDDVREPAVGPREPVAVPTPEQAARAKALDAEIARVRSVLDATTPALAESQAARERSPGTARPDWGVLAPETAASEGGATLTVLADGSVRASGHSPDRDTYTLTFKGGPKNVSAVRLEVRPAAPSFLRGPSRGDDGRRLSRLDLAGWVVARDNPLTARVFVNRLWALAFGRGIVATPDDFGAQGDRPTHPELLDWLAVEFMEHGWDVKHVVRLIVTSSTYRQSSRTSSEVRRRDPDNGRPRRAQPARGDHQELSERV